MKRVLTTLLAIIIVAGTGLAVWRRHERMQQAKTPRLAQEVPLRLDTMTANILAHPTKVETFRLADFHEGETRTRAEQDIEEKQSLGTISDHTILRIGRPQNAMSTTRLEAAMSQMRGYGDGRFGLQSQCFDPGVAFRVWKGAARTDVCVCFYCSGADIVTQDSAHRVAWQAHPDLGASRAALLALSVQAFPDDVYLLALKNGQSLPHGVN